MDESTLSDDQRRELAAMAVQLYSAVSAGALAGAMLNPDPKAAALCLANFQKAQSDMSSYVKRMLPGASHG
jgi:hypothetical protein